MKTDVLSFVRELMKEHEINDDVANEIVRDARMMYGRQTVYIKDHVIMDRRYQVIRIWEDGYKYSDKTMTMKEIANAIATTIGDIGMWRVMDIIYEYEKEMRINAKKT